MPRYGRNIVWVVWIMCFVMTAAESIGLVVPYFFSDTHFMRCFIIFEELATHYVFTERYVTRFDVFLVFVLPIVVISTCYFVVIKKIKKVDRLNLDGNLDNSEKCRQRKRTIYMLISIVVVYYVVQTPLLVVCFIEVLQRGDLIQCNDQKEFMPGLNKDLMLASFSLYMSCMVVNPFILCYFNEKLRVRIRNVVHIFESSGLPLSANYA